jgi:hypothetical protein
MKAVIWAPEVCRLRYMYVKNVDFFILRGELKCSRRLARNGIVFPVLLAISFFSCGCSLSKPWPLRPQDSLRTLPWFFGTWSQFPRFLFIEFRGPLVFRHSALVRWHFYWDWVYVILLWHFGSDRCNFQSRVLALKSTTVHSKRLVFELRTRTSESGCQSGAVARSVPVTCGPGFESLIRSSCDA